MRKSIIYLNILFYKKKFSLGGSIAAKFVEKYENDYIGKI